MFPIYFYNSETSACGYLQHFFFKMKLQQTYKTINYYFYNFYYYCHYFITTINCFEDNALDLMWRKCYRLYIVYLCDLNKVQVNGNHLFSTLVYKYKRGTWMAFKIIKNKVNAKSSICNKITMSCFLSDLADLLRDTH